MPGHFSLSELSAYETLMKQSLSEQIDESKRLRLEEIDANADKIVAGKLKTKGKKIKKKYLKRKRDGEPVVLSEEERDLSEGEALNLTLLQWFTKYV